MSSKFKLMATTLAYHLTRSVSKGLVQSSNQNGSVLTIHEHHSMYWGLYPYMCFNCFQCTL